MFETNSCHKNKQFVLKKLTIYFGCFNQFIYISLCASLQKYIESVCMNIVVTALVQHLIIIVLTIIHMNYKFHSTFIALVMKTVHIM